MWFYENDKKSNVNISSGCKLFLMVDQRTTGLEDRNSEKDSRKLFRNDSPMIKLINGKERLFLSQTLLK